MIASARGDQSACWFMILLQIDDPPSRQPATGGGIGGAASGELAPVETRPQRGRPTVVDQPGDVAVYWSTGVLYSSPSNFRYVTGCLTNTWRRLGSNQDLSGYCCAPSPECCSRSLYQLSRQTGEGSTTTPRGGR